MPSQLEFIRIQTPKGKIKFSGKADDFFDILDNTQGITEEFLYAHQPTTKETIPIYSTSDKSIGNLDTKYIPKSFIIIDGPAIVVARKGYAGRLFVVEDNKFIVHEDAYPIKPKKEYSDAVNLWWFACHYSIEFQTDRTSFWGIGDFPRERFRNQEIIIPTMDFQEEVSELYRRRILLLHKINRFKEDFHTKIESVINTLSP